jgi:predicted amidohydrolase
MPPPLRIALAQFGAGLGDVEGNLERMRALLADAASGGAALVCFPELCVSGYLLDGDDYTTALLAAVEAGKLTLAEDAREHGVTVIYGAPARAGGELVNTVVLQSPGSVCLTYAKTHMDRKERGVFARGDELVVGPGGVGLACCYDLAFPEVSRLLALGGARLLVVPMAWEVARGYVMQRVVAARAVENVAYVVCVNQSGAVGDLRFLGASCVLDPLGQVVAALGAEDELGFADVDLEWVDRLRGGDDQRAYPLLEDRRPELYGELQTSAPKTSTSYVRHQYAAAEPTGGGARSRLRSTHTDPFWREFRDGS